MAFKFVLPAMAAVLTVGGMAAAYADSAPGAAMQKADLIASAESVNETPWRNRQWHITVFESRWVNTSLPAFPAKLVTGNLGFRDVYFWGGAVSYVPVPGFDIPFFGYTLSGNSMELEGQVLKHFGKQNNFETTGAVVIRSGEIYLLKQLSFNVAWGNGLSYALSHPAYEMGPSDVRGVNSRKLQYYMGFETEFTHSAMPNIHFLLKLHHRSGIYGLISPRKTGSNFLGVALRWDIQ